MSISAHFHVAECWLREAKTKPVGDLSPEELQLVMWLGAYEVELARVKKELAEANEKLASYYKEAAAEFNEALHRSSW